MERAGANNARDVGRGIQMQSVSSSEGVVPIFLAPATGRITVRRTNGFTELDRAEASNVRDVSLVMQMRPVSCSEGVAPIFLAPATRGITVRRTLVSAVSISASVLHSRPICHAVTRLRNWYRNCAEHERLCIVRLLLY